jgi:hypothetical protein
MTARGAVLSMFAVFLAGTLIAGWLHTELLTGLSFVAGCVLAARYTRRSGLLAATVSPPALFLAALICAELLDSDSGTVWHTVAATCEGSVITLASVAPWLFAGVILGLVIAFARGLRGCVSELRAELRGDIPPRD